MGEMSNGGAPRIKTIVEKLESLAGTVDPATGVGKVNLRDGAGTEVGTETNPLHVDIRGEVPDTMDLTKINGVTPDLGSGNVGTGTLRVINATDDPNLSKLPNLDITLSALRDAVRGTGTKDLTTVETAISEVEAAVTSLKTVVTDMQDVNGNLNVDLQTSIPAGTNDIGGVNLTKLGGNAPDIGTGNAGTGTLRVINATNDPNLSKLPNLDIALSALKSAIQGTGTKDLTTVETAIAAVETAVTGLETVVTGMQDVTGNLNVDLQTSIPAGTNDIGGVNLTKLNGNTPDLGSGTVGTGTLRVINATDDPNLSKLDITLSALRDALKSAVQGTGEIDLTDVETAISAVETAVTGLETVVTGMQDANGNLNVDLQTSIPAGTNDIGGVNLTKLNGNTPNLGSGTVGTGTLRVINATDDPNLSKLDIALSALKSAIQGTGIKDLTTVETAISEVETAVSEVETAVTSLETVATGIRDGIGKVNLRDGTGTEVGTETNPLHVDIRGEVPDTMDLVKINGNTPDLGSGNVGTGTLRVINATDDPNLSKLDIALSALRDAIQGTGVKDLTTVETAISAVETAVTSLETVVTGMQDVTGYLNVDLQTSIPAGTNDIGGVNLTKLNGNTPDLGSGNVGTGTLRVINATDDPNLSKLDIALSALRDAIQGTGVKDLTTVETAISAVETAVSEVETAVTSLETVVTGMQDVTGYLNVDLQTPIPAGTNDIGGVNLTKLNGNTPDLGSGDAGTGTLRVVSASNDSNLTTIATKLDTLIAGQSALITPVVTSATGNAAISASYSPSAVFWLESVTVHFSAAPTTTDALTVTLDANDGSAYDTTLYSVIPATAGEGGGGITDVVYIPPAPLLCESGDGIKVAFTNTDTVTYGVRIVSREV